jgi:hypothetical protein
VRTADLDLEVVFADADQWHAWSWSHGQRAIWEKVPAANRDRVRAAAAERLERFRASDGQIRLVHRIRFTLAKRVLSVSPSVLGRQRDLSGREGHR